MTKEELKTQYSEVIAQIEQEAAAAERARLQSIEEIEDSVKDKQLLHAAKYGEKPMTAGQLALAAMRQQSKLGTQYLENVEKDTAASKVNDLTTAPNRDEETARTSRVSHPEQTHTTADA